MSIPFCIATTLVHGVPTTRHMTTYDDPRVAGLIERITLVSDPAVPVLSAIIEADTSQGPLTREQRMVPADYSYDLATLSAMLRRIGREEGVPMTAFDRLEAFVDRLPGGSIEDAIGAFSLPVEQRQAA
jgi:hypothetical protein